MARGTQFVALALVLALALMAFAIQPAHAQRGTNMVVLQGHVKNPGEYPLSANPTLYRLLASHSGLTDASFRGEAFEPRGEVIRANAGDEGPEILTFNVTDVLNQSPGSNISLMPGDVVRIYSADVTRVFNDYVWISGYVKRPGKYDLKRGMSLADLVIQAGGFKPEAYLLDAEVSRLDLTGIPGDTLTRTRAVQMLATYNVADNPESAISHLYQGNTPANAFKLQPYDQVHVRQNPDLRLPNNVIVEGQVLYPGTYTLEKRSETLSELMERAGGFKANAFIAGSRLMRAAEDRGLDQMLNTLREDVKNAREDLAVREQAVKNISATSASFASTAGRLPFSQGANDLGSASAEIIMAYEAAIRSYQDAKQTYEDALELNKGMKRINVDFSDLFIEGNYDEDVVLMPGDKVVVPESPGTVTVVGFVNSPGVFNYTPGKRVKYYVELAGGSKPDAGQMIVTQPTGYSIEVRWLSNPTVMEGATIQVKRRQPGEQPGQ